MGRYSSLTFGELTKDLNYIKITWNHKVIYDDYDGEETAEHLKEIEALLKDKIVKKMLVDVVMYHHCLLKIKGEKIKS